MITTINKHGYTHIFSAAYIEQTYRWMYRIKPRFDNYFNVSLIQLSAIKHKFMNFDCIAFDMKSAIRLINFHLAYLLDSFSTTYDDAKLSGVPCICCRNIFENDNDFKYCEDARDYLCEECYTAKQKVLAKEESMQKTQYTPMHYVHCVL